MQVAGNSDFTSFSYRKTFLLGFGFFGIAIIWTTFNNYVPILLQAGYPGFEVAEGVTGFGYSPTESANVMVWVNLLLAILMPWAGARSDVTSNQFGRRKGWILLGVPIAAFSFVYIPLAPIPGMLIAFVTIATFGMAIVRPATAAWLGDLFEPKDRSQANGIINLMAGIGGLIAFLAGGFLFTSFGANALFLFAGVIFVIASGIVITYVMEPGSEVENNKNPAENDSTKVPGIFAHIGQLLKNPDKSAIVVLLSIFLWFVAFQALQVSLSSFAVDAMGIEVGKAALIAGAFSITFILFSPVAGYIGTKVGQRTSIQVGLIGMTLICGLAYFTISSVSAFIAILILAGICWAMINVNSLPIVLGFGQKESMGTFTGLYYFSSQAAAIIGIGLSSRFVESSDGDYTVIWLFSAIFMGLAWMTFQFAQAQNVEPASAV